MNELKVGQKLANHSEVIGTIVKIWNHMVMFRTSSGDYFTCSREELDGCLNERLYGAHILNEEMLQSEVPKLKTKNLNVYEVFTLLAKMPEGTLVEEKVEKMEFKLSKSGEELIDNTYDEHIDEFYTLKDLLFLTFDLVEESEEDKRKEQEKKRKEKEVSDLEKQIGEIQSKIALLKLSIE